MERFEFLSTLGEGAYGTVWKCMDKENPGRMVAMKRFKEAHLDEEVMRLAVREIRLLQSSHHPNVVQLHEAFQSKSGRVYMVMEHVDNTLAEGLKQHPRGLSAAKVMATTWQLLQATAFLHTNKIIHRDLKPANVLMHRDGTVKLCDFGLARTIASAESPGHYTQYVVTRWYRPPELLIGGAYGAPADVWAIGCLFIEMVTGQPMFPGKHALDQLYLIMRMLGPLSQTQMQAINADPSLCMCVPSPGDRRSLSQRLPDFTPQMMEVVRACLHPDPAQRLTAREVMALPYFDAVHDHLQGTAVQAAYDEAYEAVVLRGSRDASTAACLSACRSKCVRERRLAAPAPAQTDRNKIAQHATSVQDLNSAGVNSSRVVPQPPDAPQQSARQRGVTMPEPLQYVPEPNPATAAWVASLAASPGVQLGRTRASVRASMKGGRGGMSHRVSEGSFPHMHSSQASGPPRETRGSPTRSNSRSLCDPLQACSFPRC